MTGSTFDGFIDCTNIKQKGWTSAHEWIFIQSTLEMEKNAKKNTLPQQKISCMNSSVFPYQFQKVVNCPWMLDSTLPCKINPSWLLEFMRIPSYVSIDNSGPVSEMLHSGWSRPKLISFNRSRFWEKCCSKVYVLHSKIVSNLCNRWMYSMKIFHFLVINIPFINLQYVNWI